MNARDVLSVVVPVYNSERYLPDCLDSILSQSYKNIEVILVDNMSTDASLSICQQYAQKDRRIKILSEAKCGAAAARNCGLIAAKGRYITFVDSDDYLEIEAYKKMLNQLEREQSDGVCCSFFYVDENGESLGWYEPRLDKYIQEAKSYRGIDVARIFLTSYDIEGFAWNKIFKRSIFVDNNIKFEEDKRAYEDMAIIFKAITCCGKVALCSDKLYYYRQNPVSLVHTLSSNEISTYQSTILKIEKLATDIKLFEEAEFFFVDRTVGTMFSLWRCFYKDKGQWDEVRKLYQWNKVFQNRSFFYVWSILMSFRGMSAKKKVKLIISKLFFS